MWCSRCVILPRVGHSIDCLGFVVSDEEPGRLYLRGLEEIWHHSIVLEQTNDTPTCQRVGLRVYDESELEAAARHFQKAGLPPIFVERPYQGNTLHVSDAVGTPLEICARMETRPRLIVNSITSARPALTGSTTSKY
jgi:catechol 2,3-dioxygenase